MRDFFGIAKLSDNSIDFFKPIYQDLAKPGVIKVGYALETVLDSANTILLPIKMVNDKCKIRMKKHMIKYEEKMDKIPEENIGKVPLEIGLDIIDELLKTTNEEIADLFINLLTSASSIDKSRYAHPGFVSTIKNISVDEARILNYLSANYEKLGPIIYIRFFREDPDDLGIPIGREYNNLNSLVDLNFEENKLFYVDNLVRLGIIEGEVIFYGDDDLYDELLTEYSDVKKELEVALEKSHNKKDSYISVTKGSYRLSDYGIQFLESISID